MEGRDAAAGFRVNQDSALRRATSSVAKFGLGSDSSTRASRHRTPPVKTAPPVGCSRHDFGDRWRAGGLLSGVGGPPEVEGYAAKACCRSAFQDQGRSSCRRVCGRSAIAEQSGGRVRGRRRARRRAHRPRPVRCPSCPWPEPAQACRRRADVLPPARGPRSGRAAASAPRRRRPPGRPASTGSDRRPLSRSGPSAGSEASAAIM